MKRSLRTIVGSMNKTMVLFIVLVAVVGSVMYVSTRAATFNTASEAEQGTVVSPATIVGGTGASGDAAVRFGSAQDQQDQKDLSDPQKKEIAMELVSSAENSSLDWKAQYGYIEDIKDGRGYTGGIIGFTSGTHDMLELVQYYTQLAPGNILAKYIPALQKVDGSNSHAGLDPTYVNDWKQAAQDTRFQKAQNDERDRSYFNPAVAQGKTDGLRALGQFIYYDAYVMHGPGNDADSFGGIRAAAHTKAKFPAEGGDEKAYLNAFLDARVAAMRREAAHDDTSRVDTAQRKFLNDNNFNLDLPLTWQVYGDSYTIR